ncbi:MAG: hypothetical protein ACREC9_14795 [Methylocella sp.]
MNQGEKIMPSRFAPRGSGKVTKQSLKMPIESSKAKESTNESNPAHRARTQDSKCDSPAAPRQPLAA